MRIARVETKSINSRCRADRLLLRGHYFITFSKKKSGSYTTVKLPNLFDDSDSFRFDHDLNIIGTHIHVVGS